MTTNRQLELGFNGTQARIFGRRPASRAARGKWWFARMREAVASAMDWPMEASPRPEQISFSDANRELKA
jgi:hypothetical protein